MICEVRQMPKVSVIVPVYNVENYLSSCLESILSQSLMDMEIICVDDGSTDNSGRILDQYALRDNRIKVIHRLNAGYGASMNVGLSAASGEYIGIVESDDRIKPEMYQTLYAAAVQDDLDLVKSDVMYWIEGIDYVKEIHYQWLDDYYERVLSDADRNLFFDFFMNIWTGIYKRSFLEEKKIRFHESPGASYQDNGFWMQTLLYCKKAKWINGAFYLYRQDNPYASVKSKGQMLSMAKEYEYLAQILCEKKDYHLLSYCYYYKLFRHRGTFFRIEDELKREFCKQIEDDFIVYQGFIKGNSCLESWMREIVKKPDEMCRKVIEKKQEIYNKLNAAETIVIYGAGRRGDIVFRGLYNEGYYGKLACFAVSHKSTNMLMARRQVLTIQDAIYQYPGALIIIAVIKNSGAYHQMVRTLLTLGVNDYIDGTDIEENFYIL